MSAAARHSQVLLAFWRQRDLNAPWGRRFVAALVVLVCAAGLIWLPERASWMLVAGMALLVVLGFWLAVCGNLQEQNHPSAARSVPGHLRTLRHAALAGWALCTALSTLLLWAIFPPNAPWQVLLLSCGFIAVFLLWSSRMVWLWLALTLLSPLTGLWAAPLAPLGRALAAAWQAQTSIMLLLGLLVEAVLVVAAFGDGGARHQARYARQTLMRNAMRMQLEGKQMANPAIWGRAFEWLTRPYSLAFDTWQQRLLGGADNGDVRHVMARAAIVLHGPQHWLYQLMAVGSIATLVMSIFGIVFATTPADMSVIFRNGAFGMGVAIASMGYNPAFALPGVLFQSRREQALLCLLPGMPRGAALNHAVARLQLRDAFVGWLITSLILLALGLLADSPWLLCLPLAVLPISAINLTRQPARLRAPTAFSAVVPVFAFFLLAGLLYLLARYQDVPLWLLAVSTVAASAALFAWRWRALGTAPAALPAGRLA